MKPIYKPSGKAKEYGEYALNIYTGCSHSCTYCFAPKVLRRDKEVFHSNIQPRTDIIKATARQLEVERITGKTIHLCFTCDAYPTGFENAPTRAIIKLLKNSGNHIQILTKGKGNRDFDLLNENDWYGITYSCDDNIAKTEEPNAILPSERLKYLQEAKERGIKTWVSFEPVLDADAVLECIRKHHRLFDKIKIGKLNYQPSEIDWKEFGCKVETLCKELGVDYYIKESLKTEMR